MLRERLIGKALGSPAHPISVDRSRCMRMRFMDNQCNICRCGCRAGAITIGNDIVINADKCTSCMVCVSECPAGCFASKGGDFYGILLRLRKLLNAGSLPVFGCGSAADVDAHEKTSCLGSLSEEHLIAMSIFLDGPVQLNLTSCAQCINSFTVDRLKRRMAHIRETTGVDVRGKAVLIEDRADLRYEAVSYDRRGFFSAVKNMTLLGATRLFENNEDGAGRAYSQKGVPPRRDLLNRSVIAIKDNDIAARILKEYAFTVRADDSCDSCFSCVGICPTGALKSRRADSSEARLLFNPSMCIGCALCKDFCLGNSIAVLQGYSGANYFEHEICGKEPCEASAA